MKFVLFSREMSRLNLTFLFKSYVSCKVKQRHVVLGGLKKFFPINFMINKKKNSQVNISVPVTEVA